LLVTRGAGVYHADFGAFPFRAPVLLFATPMQVVYLAAPAPVGLTMLQFHGDFYCIEYHRPEVACNGLLFNNIYLEPSVQLSAGEERHFSLLLEQLGEEFGQALPSLPVLRAYLQLLLAKSSSLKTRSMARETNPADPLMEQFRELLETHYLTLHKPSDYAQLLSIPSNTFTKRSRRYFRKTPSELIQERLVLEAKKRLHLTRSSIKEIAYSLRFADEFYFSRFFKKFTGVSPQAFRDRTGISIVARSGAADLSK
jgi:AraC-like DNA-binding protein